MFYCLVAYIFMAGMAMYVEMVENPGRSLITCFLRSVIWPITTFLAAYRDCRRI